MKADAFPEFAAMTKGRDTDDKRTRDHPKYT